MPAVDSLPKEILPPKSDPQFTVASADPFADLSVKAEKPIDATAQLPDDNKTVALVAQAKSGDTRAFDELVKPLLPMMRSFLIGRGLASQNSIDDVVQEVTIKAWQNLSTFRAEAKFSTWLLAIAHNTAYNMRRKEVIRSRLRVDDPEGFLTERATGPKHDRPDRVGDSERIVAIIHRQIETLSPRHQEAVTAQIEGRAKDTSPTARTRLFYARAALREKFRRREIPLGSLSRGEGSSDGSD